MERYKETASDIAMMQTLNGGKGSQHFLLHVISDNKVEIVAGLFILAGIIGMALMFIEGLPAPRT